MADKLSYDHKNSIAPHAPSAPESNDPLQARLKAAHDAYKVKKRKDRLRKFFSNTNAATQRLPFRDD
jgi:hypothetical protein